MTRVEEYGATLNPTDGIALTVSEFSVRYAHLALGSRVGLQSETERREADVAGRLEERTSIHDTRMNCSEFLAFAGSEGRSILDHLVCFHDVCSRRVEWLHCRVYLLDWPVQT